MTALVQSLGDFLTLLVQAFNLSSIFPALVFVLLLRLFVLPLLPEAFAMPIHYMLDTFSEAGALAMLVVLLAYLLDAANMQIIRLFEGYPLVGQFPFNWWRQRHQAHIEETIEQIECIEEWLDDLMPRRENEPDEVKRALMGALAYRLADYRNTLLGRFQNKYPKDPDYVLPTAFGNVIAAAEQYPYEAFGMDAVTLWPFLRPILTEKQYAPFLVREKAIMDFLINLTLILAIFGAVFGYTSWLYAGLNWEWVILLGAIALSCGILFYLSVQGAAGWGTTVRAAFVVFREELRKRLRLRRASDYKDERALWESASQFFRVESHKTQQIGLGGMIFDDASYRMD